MNSPYLRFILVSLVLVALQVWVLSPIALFRIATPFLYPILLLLLPIGTGRSTQALLGFGIGMLIDIFRLTPGLHTTAFTLTAYLRQPLLNLFVDKNTPEYTLPLYPTLRGGAVVLFSLLLLIHLTVLFALEAGLQGASLHLGMSFLASYAFSWVLHLITLFFFGTSEGARTN